MHGAGGGANPGSDHPNYRHGMRSEELKVVRAMTRLLAKIPSRKLKKLGRTNDYEKRYRLLDPLTFFVAIYGRQLGLQVWPSRTSEDWTGGGPSW